MHRREPLPCRPRLPRVLQPLSKLQSQSENRRPPQGTSTEFVRDDDPHRPQKKSDITKRYQGFQQLPDRQNSRTGRPLETHLIPMLGRPSEHSFDRPHVTAATTCDGFSGRRNARVKQVVRQPATPQTFHRNAFQLPSRQLLDSEFYATKVVDSGSSRPSGSIHCFPDLLHCAGRNYAGRSRAAR